MTSAAAASSITSLLSTPYAFIDSLLHQSVLTATASASAATAPLTHTQLTQLAQSNWNVESSVRNILGIHASTSPIRSSSTVLLNSIPSLNEQGNGTVSASHLRPNTLVRFRGMVQETFQPDYYMGLMKTKSNINEFISGKYRDVLEKGPNTNEIMNGMNERDESITLERLSINVVPIPGEAQWVSEAVKKMEIASGHVPAQSASSASSIGKSNPKKNKRALDDNEGGAMDTGDEEKSSSNSLTDSSSSPATAASAGADSTPSKKGRSDQQIVNGTASASSTQDHGFEVIVTLYDEYAASLSPRVCQCYEFIGILTCNPDLSADMEFNSQIDEIGTEIWGPRRNRALRMHVLTMIPIYEGFPFVANPTIDAQAFSTQRTELNTILPAIRSSLITYLTELLGGDSLAAEVVLLTLLQRVETRGIGIAGKSMVGKLVTNLILPNPTPSVASTSEPMSNSTSSTTTDSTTPTGPTQFVTRLMNGLEQILNRSRKLDLNISTLNKNIWQPKKNYDEESLESNLLHLTSPSTLVLDETSLNSGTLNSVGIKNLQVLSSLIQTAELNYDFGVQDIIMKIDYSILLISVGGRSLLQQEGQFGVDITYKINPIQSIDELYSNTSTPSPTNPTEVQLNSNTSIPSPTKPTEIQLNYWRVYLCLARQNNFQIKEEHSKSIEDHFVQLRKIRPTCTNETTLHLILNLTRLYCLSHLESECSAARWTEVTQLFEAIHARTPVATTTNSTAGM